ncbi:MAG TPA: hypothetical protein PK794_06855 [Armatimonadota bacterium]|nr:hypothetical protein [Armatimonadota bacterium]
MSRGIPCILLLAAGLLVHAGMPTPTWEGMVGLFTLPTAETLPANRPFAVTFSEIRFSQSNNTARVRNVWYTGSLTWRPTDDLELAVTLRHEYLHAHHYADPFPAAAADQKWTQVAVKYLLVPPDDRRLGLAAGVLDLTDVTDIGFGDSGADRGRRAFLVGTYAWFSLGLTYDNRGLGAVAGARWSVSDAVEIIAEYSTDPVFLQAHPEPAIDANFNLGLRLYPREVPGLRLDTVAVGDGRFDFGFSVSYLFP